MTFAIRAYQSTLIDRTREALREHDAVVLQLPTGGGKTGIAGCILRMVVDRGKTAYFLCHRHELVDQTARTFEDFGIPYGIIAAGYTPSRSQPVQICSIDTLKARLARGASILTPALIALDECHHVASPGWARLMASVGRCKVIGLTATPERLDGKGLRPPFNAIVSGPSVAELTEQGYLSSAVVYAPAHDPDLSGVGTVAGDYNRKQLADVMGASVLIGDAVAHYRRLCDKVPALAFCVTVHHAEQVAAQFAAAGYRATMVEGNTDKKVRRDAIRALGEGRLDVLTSCMIFSEGVDCPPAKVAIMLRPTKSLALWLQMCGRILRPIPGVTATILDHAGNCRVHGLPDEPREWSLDGRRKRRKATDAGPPVKQCPACFAMCPAAARECPACGAAFEVQAREVKHLDGELERVTGRARIMPATTDPTMLMVQGMTYQQRLGWVRRDDARLKLVAAACGYDKGWIWRKRKEWGTWRPKQAAAE